MIKNKLIRGRSRPWLKITCVKYNMMKKNTKLYSKIRMIKQKNSKIEWEKSVGSINGMLSV